MVIQLGQINCFSLLPVPYDITNHEEPVPYAIRYLMAPYDKVPVPYDKVPVPYQVDPGIPIACGPITALYPSM